MIRGDHVCVGYWNDPELTRVRIRDGWLHTQDMGSLDVDGYVHFLGRVDDIINVGGVKVSPDTIEGVVRGVPGVLDCAAVGASDPRGVYGEVPIVYVVGDQGAGLSAQAVKAYCAQHLQPEAVPYEVRFVATLPRTDTGKLQRRTLRAALVSPSAAGVHP